MLRVWSPGVHAFAGDDVADVEAQADRFGLQYQLFSAASEPMLCMHLHREPPIPLDVMPMYITPLQADAYTSEQGQLLVRRAREQAEAMAAQWTVPLERHEPDSAAQFFQVRLERFLAARFSVTRTESTLGKVTKQLRNVLSRQTGYSFKVHTQRAGLRVRHSKALSPRFTEVFGAPTTPVEGWLKPGVWVFAVEGPDLMLTPDTGEYDVPRHREAHLIVT